VESRGPWATKSLGPPKALKKKPRSSLYFLPSDLVNGFIYDSSSQAPLALSQVQVLLDSFWVSRVYIEEPPPELVATLPEDVVAEHLQPGKNKELSQWESEPWNACRFLMVGSSSAIAYVSFWLKPPRVLRMTACSWDLGDINWTSILLFSLTSEGNICPWMACVL
jgi:hypothetical protein